MNPRCREKTFGKLLHASHKLDWAHLAAHSTNARRPSSSSGGHRRASKGRVHASKSSCVTSTVRCGVPTAPGRLMQVDRAADNSRLARSTAASSC